MIEALLSIFLEPLLGMLAHVVGVLCGMLFEMFCDVFLQILVNVFAYAVALPLCCITSTPVVLIRALFGPGHYLVKVTADYRAICAGVLTVGSWI